ncbi:MAG: DUF3598 family protein [Leptolyngbyaceae cyanobacterium CSU_1_4]|nr:DUF3598 family protein [Leptolyngbyaceae cyanobacterium CSU_1_4]
MKSQWDCVLQNLGKWQGSFAHFSPQGILQEDIPSVISLEGVDNNRSIHLVLRRYYLTPESTRVPQEMVVDFSAPGRGALFFETGAFSEGGIYCFSQGTFGAESCLVDQNRRLRLVLLFDASRFSKLTLIREQRVGTDAPEQPLLQLEDLLGEWQGQTVTRYFATEKVDRQSSFFRLARQEAGLNQQLDETGRSTLCHEGGRRAPGSAFEFEWEGQVYQTLLLPDGASATCPLQITQGNPFFLEIGWLRPSVSLSKNFPWLDSD